jgi:hypothetical protein
VGRINRIPFEKDKSLAMQQPMTYSVLHGRATGRNSWHNFVGEPLSTTDAIRRAIAVSNFTGISVKNKDSFHTLDMSAF